MAEIDGGQLDRVVATMDHDCDRDDDSGHFDMDEGEPGKRSRLYLGSIGVPFLSVGRGPSAPRSSGPNRLARRYFTCGEHSGQGDAQVGCHRLAENTSSEEARGNSTPPDTGRRGRRVTRVAPAFVIEPDTIIGAGVRAPVSSHGGPEWERRPPDAKLFSR
jgi:hypothetical protein